MAAPGPVSRSSPAPGDRRERLVLLAGALLVAAGFAASGDAATSRPGWITLPRLVLHTLCLHIGSALSRRSWSRFAACHATRPRSAASFSTRESSGRGPPARRRGAVDAASPVAIGPDRDRLRPPVLLDSLGLRCSSVFRCHQSPGPDARVDEVRGRDTAAAHNQRGSRARRGAVLLRRPRYGAAAARPGSAGRSPPPCQ